MTYNPPPGNITTNVEIFQWINDTIGGFFFTGVLFAIFFIIFIKLMFSTDDNGKSFAAASFICMILSVLLRAADLLDTTIMVIFIILTAVGAVWMHVENTKYG